MLFDKPAITLADQILLLESRGMTFSDKRRATHYLSNISYYRLSAYWYTFLEEPKSNHVFKENTRFEQVVDTYVFDRKLRILIFDEIERIEIAFRTQVIYQFCQQFGTNWYETKSLFRRDEYYDKFTSLIIREMDHTSEVFIEHYRSKYTNPENPPAWMALELASLGQLSQLYKNLRKCDAHKKIAKHFGVHETVFTSWLEALSYVRNACAHHSRLWNRKLPKSPVIPTTTERTWLRTVPVRDKQNRIYLTLAVVAYLLQSIIPGSEIIPRSSFGKKLSALLDDYPELPLDYMGFPNSWAQEPLWGISI